MELKPLILNPPPNVTKITDEEGLSKLTDFFSRCGGVCGWDIETTVTNDFYWRRVRTVQFGNSKEQYVIDLLGFCKDSDELHSIQGNYGKNLNEGLSKVLSAIRPVLEDVNFIKVGVNLGFEFENFYWLFGVSACGFFDCMLVERIIFAGLHSLKDYPFYSMEEMAARYLEVSIDKTLQTSFNLEDELSQEQLEYAALDTRLPLALKYIQELVIKGNTPELLRKNQRPELAKYLDRLERRVLGDNLEEICAIENNAIPVFQQMHIHGERLDKDRWLTRVNKSKQELSDLIVELDKIFIPIVGTKNDVITQEEVDAATEAWRGYNIPSDEEVKLSARIRVAKKAGESAADMEQILLNWKEIRKLEKDKYKKVCSDLKKRQTKLTKLVAQCDGQALINYSSDSQLLSALKENFKGLENLTSLDDEVLEDYKSYPVMVAIKKYHGLAKDIGTYGDQWVTEWKTQPGKEEGWLHPGDHRLHCKFNQLEAETGRTSSSQPNAQNLLQDKEVRSSFVSDEPDEQFPNGYQLITIDMAGAELRILAEGANDPIWIGAFNRKEDVHAVCTEMVEAAKWPLLALPDCAYFVKREDGTPQKKKCNCPEHNKLRNSMKPTNFGIPYGIGPTALSKQINKTYSETLKLMNKHRKFFPNIWAYLDDSGQSAKRTLKAFDMFGRRRLFSKPDWEKAKQFVMEEKAADLLLPEKEFENDLSVFRAINKREPNKDELFILKHKTPSHEDISKKFYGMWSSIERQGKNHRIQSGNATIIKLAMGAGKDKNGIPFLFHILPKYCAKILKMVHDELVIQAPKIYAVEVAEKVKDAFARAAAERMTKVVMDSEYHIADYWSK